MLPLPALTVGSLKVTDFEDCRPFSHLSATISAAADLNLNSLQSPPPFLSIRCLALTVTSKLLLIAEHDYFLLVSPGHYRRPLNTDIDPTLDPLWQHIMLNLNLSTYSSSNFNKRNIWKENLRDKSLSYLEW